MTRLLTLILLLTACTVPIERFATLAPADSRAYGVYVKDGAERSGTIVHSEWGTFATMEQRCFGGVDHHTRWGGCARAVDDLTFPAADHRYAIYYAEHTCYSYHEAAHALYETRQHTVAYSLRVMQGDQFAACP